MKFHKPHICQLRGKKFSNRTNNSHAKLTLHSTFSPFHFQFINETAQPKLQIHSGSTILPFMSSCPFPAPPTASAHCTPVGLHCTPVGLCAQVPIAAAFCWVRDGNGPPATGSWTMQRTQGREKEETAAATGKNNFWYHGIDRTWQGGSSRFGYLNKKTQVWMLSKRKPQNTAVIICTPQLHQEET